MCKAPLLTRKNLLYVEDNSYAAQYCSVVCFDLVTILLSLSASFEVDPTSSRRGGYFSLRCITGYNQYLVDITKYYWNRTGNSRVVRLIKSLYDFREALELWVAIL